MIPQPLKWVGAVVALGIFLAVVGPMAYSALIDMVTIADGGGLLGGEDELAGEDDDGAEARAPGDPDGGDGTEPEGDDADDGDGDTGDDGDGDTDDDGDGDTTEPPDTYTVESGDTLFSIAEEVYGEGSRWREIADENDITESSGITVGQELVIP